MLERYTVDNFLSALSHPQLFFQEVRRILFKARHGEGINVMERDWDNLVLLDACRYDAFARRHSFDGALERVVSRGCTSWEFIEENFVGRDVTSTVYVTGNPYADKLDDETFYTVEPVYKEWDEETETVLPERVFERAIEANEQYPDKRLIVHFMQPHHPYIGTNGRELMKQFDLNGWDKYVDAQSEGVRNIFDEVEAGNVSHDQLWELYRENLDIALEYTEELLDALDGKSVVSADHGEMLGERPMLGIRPRYVHPDDLHTEELRIVPWLVVPSDDRREVTADPAIGFDRLSEGEVDKRLQALGYKT